MGWIYLAELADSALPLEIGSDHSLTVSGTRTHKECYFLEWSTAIWSQPQSSPTSVTLRRAIYVRPLTLSTEASHARISVLQDMELAWVESEADFSGTSPVLSRKQTQDSFFSKTSQQLELVASTVSLKHLPSSGMISGGQFCQPKKLAPATFAKDGSDLPTPTASGYGSNQGGAAGRKGKRRLSIEAMAGRGLIPAPMARDWKGSAGANRESADLPRTMGGSLNPQFVEEVMGYLIGWTELKGSATQWFRSKRKQRL